MTDSSSARRLPLVLATTLAVALPVAALAAAAVTTPSGLVYTSVVEGKGRARPPPTRSRSTTAAPSRRQGVRQLVLAQRPATFPLNRVIPCWTEAVQKMKVGGKAQLVCPPSIATASGAQATARFPPNATLRFEVELLEINPR
jgi:FKBP-type peptidyl-prolyl cis-trans isomerase FkpA